MSKKVHIICGKCGSTEMNFVLNDVCPDDPQAHVSMLCKNCCELTSVAEWSEFNDRKIEDRRKPYDTVRIDIDGFVIDDDVEELSELGVKDRKSTYLEVVIQKDSGRVTRYFGNNWNKIYDQCWSNPRVIMFSPQ